MEVGSVWKAQGMLAAEKERSDVSPRSKATCWVRRGRLGLGGGEKGSTLGSSAGAHAPSNGSSLCGLISRRCNGWVVPSNGSGLCGLIGRRCNGWVVRMVVLADGGELGGASSAALIFDAVVKVNFCSNRG